MEYKYPSFPRFNDHGSTCKGHSNFMLDCEFETKEERDILIQSINNYLPKSEKVEPKKTEQAEN